MAPIVLVIDGEIGAGKSTLVGILAEHLTSKYGLNVQTIYEPVKSWLDCGILTAFYENKKEMAFPFQIKTFTSRVDAGIEAVKEIPDADIYIAERSIWTDYLFMLHVKEMGLLDDSTEGTPGEMLFGIYKEIWKHWKDLLPVVPTHHIYLKPTMITCMDRVTERCRDGEPSGVTLEYQESLRRYHEAYLEGKHPDLVCKFPEDTNPENVLVIPHGLADADFRGSPDSDDIVTIISEFLKIE